MLPLQRNPVDRGGSFGGADFGVDVAGAVDVAAAEAGDGGPWGNSFC